MEDTSHGFLGGTCLLSLGLRLRWLVSLVLPFEAPKVPKHVPRNLGWVPLPFATGTFRMAGPGFLLGPSPCVWLVQVFFGAGDKQGKSNSNCQLGSASSLLSQSSQKLPLPLQKDTDQLIRLASQTGHRTATKLPKKWHQKASPTPRPFELSILVHTRYRPPRSHTPKLICSSACAAACDLAADPALSPLSLPPNTPPHQNEAATSVMRDPPCK